MKLLVAMPEGLARNIEALHALKQLSQLRPEIEIFLFGGVQWLRQELSFGQEADLSSSIQFQAVVSFSDSFAIGQDLYRRKIPVRIGFAGTTHSFLYTATNPLPTGYHGLPLAHGYWRLLTLLEEELWSVPLTVGMSSSDLNLSQKNREIGKLLVIAPFSSVHNTSPFPARAWADLIRAVPSHVLCVLPKGADLFKSQLLKVLGSEISNLEFTSEDDSGLVDRLRSDTRYIGASTDCAAFLGTLGIAGTLIVPSDSAESFSAAPFVGNFTLVSVQGLNGPDVLLDAEKLSDIRRRTKISAFIVCCNEESKIERCLQSVSFCDEIVVIDSGSTDRTLEIAKRFTQQVFHNEWHGYTAQKQFGLDRCSNDWVLNLDADEEVSSELRGEIQLLLAAERSGKLELKNGYQISRVVCHLGRWWRKGGWYPEYRLRLLRRSAARWGGVDPHEKAEIRGPTGRISGELYHYTYKNIADQLERVGKYSTIGAEQLFARGEGASVSKIFIRPLARFVKFAIFKGGFREGTAGWIVAGIEGYYVFQKYSKLWELQRAANSCSLKRGSAKTGASDKAVGE